MTTSFRLWLGIRSTVGGWVIGIIGGTTNHFTNSELAVVLALIGCIVPLGVAYLTSNRRNDSTMIHQLREDNARLRKQLREMTKQ